MTNASSNEKFFRMLSIALLGALALACVPDSGATALNQQPSATIGAQAAVPVEIEVLGEVTEINAGRFNPAVAGDVPDSRVQSLTQAEARLEKQFDPNF